MQDVTFSLVKETLELILGIEINSPMKNDFKQSFLTRLIQYCESKGAEKVTIENSFYIMGERPERNRVFEVSLTLRCRVKELIKICIDIFNFYHKLNNVVTIIVSRKNGWRGVFIKEGQKNGTLRILNSEKYVPTVRASIIDVEVAGIDSTE